MRVLLVVVALVALLAALVAAAPATLVDARVADASAGRLRLADARGTVWSGRGVLGAADGRWRVPLAWRLDPLALLRGTVALALVPQGEAAAAGSVSARDGNVQAKDLHLALPAAALQAALPAATPVTLTGQVMVDAPALRLANGEAGGAFDARWQNASLLLDTWRLDLGTVTAHGEPVSPGMRISLANAGGEATIAGLVHLQPDRVVLDATLTPAGALAPSLALLLRSLGSPAANGGVHIAWQVMR